MRLKYNAKVIKKREREGRSRANAMTNRGKFASTNGARRAEENE